MSRTSSAGYVLIVAVALAVAVVALRPTMTETETFPPVSLPDPGAGLTEAVVIAVREFGGFELLGLTFGKQTRTVTVQFYAPGGCYELLTTGDLWPVPFEQCASPIEIDGIVSGGGIAATGESIVAVDIEVDAACFDAITAGDTWPQPACG